MVCMVGAQIVTKRFVVESLKDNHQLLFNKYFTLLNVHSREVNYKQMI